MPAPVNRLLGKRQAGALTVLWVMHPLPVKGRVLGDVLAPGESSTNMRKSIAALALRGFIVGPELSRPGADSLHVSWRLSNDGILALRRYALSRGSMTVEVIK